MRKIILLFVFGGIIQTISAQQLLPIQHDTNTYSHEYFMAGIIDYSSTSIENGFSNKFIRGGNITEELKDNSFSRHKGINRVGADISGEIEYRNYAVNLCKNEEWGFTIKGGYYNYVSATYSKDLFGLTFYGNEQYLGENVQFSGSRISEMSFQKIGFGWINKKSKSNISFNLYTISNYAEGIVKEGNIFQSEAGDSVSFTFDGSLEYSTGSNFVKGYGAGVDLDFRIPVILRKDQVSYFQFLAKNIGVSHLNSVKRHSADTVITYDGFTFDQLYNGSNVLNDNFSILDTLGINSRVISRFRFLPGFLQIGKIVDQMNPARVQSFFGVRMYPSIAYVPMVYAGAQFRTTSWLHIGVNVSYGGYSNFKFGIYSQINYKKIALGIATEDMYGDISSHGRGKSLIVRLRVKL